MVDDKFDPGMYTQYWDGRDDGGRRLAAGVYFYRIRIGDFTDSRKTLLLR